MSENHPLDHPDARTAVINSVSSSGSLADAGSAAGVTKTRLSRYLKAHPDFAAEVAAARVRSEVVGHHAPRMLPPNPPMGDPGEIATLGDPHERARRLVAKCERFLEDEDAPPALRAKALHVLAEYDLGSLVHARRLQAQREATDDASAKTDTRPVIIRHGAAPPRVVDAELIERTPRLDS